MPGPAPLLCAFPGFSPEMQESLAGSARSVPSDTCLSSLGSTLPSQQVTEGQQAR